MGTKLLVLFACLALTIVLAAKAIRPAPPPAPMCSYATTLDGRTPNQRYNARRAAQCVDGYVLEPGAVFSFNIAVGGWSEQKGYREAPVSFNGVLVDDFGGGVCQTSTTVYNAALLAGLPIVERHAHTIAPGYVAAGRDAAVAYQNVDLRFRNPYAYPLVLHARVKDGLLLCGFTSTAPPSGSITVDTRVLDRFRAPPAPPAPGEAHRRSRWHLMGRDGVRVITVRSFYDVTGKLRRTELVSDSSYRGISAETPAVLSQ